jgi:hypothetical protein
LVSKNKGIKLLSAGLLLIVVVLLLIAPIPQAGIYHHFADKRSWKGIANVSDVLSNIPFALAGIWGLFILLFSQKVQFIDERERYFWFGISVGLILTAVGSCYYHLAPDNFRLMWDRLGIMTMFMSLVAALIGERINVRLGLWLWPVLLGLGYGSVWWWYTNEVRGTGDLRFYFGLQALTILVLLVMSLVSSAYNRSKDLVIVVLFFGLARLCEMYDHQIYGLSSNIISGHTLKHFAAAAAGIWLIGMLWKRKILRGISIDE